MASNGYLRFITGAPPAAVGGWAGGTFYAFNPVALSSGVVVASAADDTAMLGWATANATSGDRVAVYPAIEIVQWVLPIGGTVGGEDCGTAAGQVALGATLGGPAVRNPGSTLKALIGTKFALGGTANAWYVDLSDTSHDLLLLQDFEYNEGTGLWEGVCTVVAAARQYGTAGT
jgi:hypothetical protein